MVRDGILLNYGVVELKFLGHHDVNSGPDGGLILNLVGHTAQLIKWAYFQNHHH